jgi:endonuclease YncB( thermonuclease family)
MRVVKYGRQNKSLQPWLYRKTSILGLTRYRVIKLAPVGILAVILLAAFLSKLVNGETFVSTAEPSISVIDGDTIRTERGIYRLVGFDTPESDTLARCERERTLAAAATKRLRELVSSGAVILQTIPCACSPGTEGTQACNFGRACGVLKTEGRDVGSILISEGLARPYICGRTGCPRRKTWCG